MYQPLNIRFNQKEAEIAPFEIVIGPEIEKIEATDPGRLPFTEMDYRHIREFEFYGKKPPEGRKPIYLATAGPPGPGKSVLLDQQVRQRQELKDAIFSDPDRGVLEFMQSRLRMLSPSEKFRSRANDPVFQAYSANHPEMDIVAKLIFAAGVEAYERLRVDSNIIANLIRNEAFAKRFDIVHGTTSTGPPVPKLLDNYKAGGYQIDLLLVNSSDETRRLSVQKRNVYEAFPQVTPGDFDNKSWMFAERQKAYFEKADNLDMYWRFDVAQDAVHAAQYKDGKVVIVNETAYKAYIGKYEADRAALAPKGIEVPTWQIIEASYTGRGISNLKDALGSGPQTAPHMLAF